VIGQAHVHYERAGNIDMNGYIVGTGTPGFLALWSLLCCGSVLWLMWVVIAPLSWIFWGDLWLSVADPHLSMVTAGGGHCLLPMMVGPSQ